MQTFDYAKLYLDASIYKDKKFCNEIEFKRQS